MSEVKYYEVEFTNDWAIAIKGVRKPTPEEAQKFTGEDPAKYKAVDVREISFKEVLNFFDASRIDKWPVFGLDNPEQRNPEDENKRLRDTLETLAHSVFDVLGELECIDTEGLFRTACKAQDALDGKDAAAMGICGRKRRREMNENESIEDVLHDMRCAGTSDIELGFDSEAERLRGFVVRIEAAHKRELAKAAEYAAQALNAQPDARGNIAAIREALERIDKRCRLELENPINESDPTGGLAMCDILAITDDALAAPPRNCDKGFRDIEEYRLAFKRECRSHEDCADCPISKTDAFKNGVLCFFTWLLSADEGGAK